MATKKQGILARMAELKEQANVIRALQDFHEKVPAVSARKDKKAMVGAYFGAIDENEILKYLCKQRLFKGETIETVQALKDDSPELWGRRSRVGTLYRSCLDDNFVEPLKIRLSEQNPNVDMGMRIKSRGTDLLTTMGFITIAFEKHSKIITFFWGAIAGLAGSGAIWILAHLPQVLQFFGL